MDRQGGAGCRTGRAPWLRNRVAPRQPLAAGRRIAIGAAAAWLLAALGGCGGGSDATAEPAGMAAISPTGGALALEPDCSGPDCGALDGRTYAGIGVGAWRATNTGESAQSLDLQLEGVAPGQRVLLLVTGSSGTTPPPPGGGTFGEVAPLQGLPSLVTAHEAHAHAHRHLQLKERELDRAWLNAAASSQENTQVQPEAMRIVGPAPPLGSVRTWFDTFGPTRVPYMTRVQAVCPLAQGRRAVFWVDPQAAAAGLVQPQDLQAMQDAFCGESGGFARLVNWLGDAWGPHGQAALIADAPLQDIHIALIDAPPGSGWAAYFSNQNKYRMQARPDSNEALLLLVRASLLRVDRPFMISTLVHEATHLINNYQRTVRRGTLHDPWLEETSAMMSEDVVTPRVLRGDDGRPYNKIVDVRLPGYLASGGAVSYTDWTQLSLPHYDLGGAFAAWLNRRYGLALARALVTECNQGLAPGGSHACLDGRIRAQGGPGFATEFARFGATVFATLPARAVPQGYRYPARQEGDYSLASVDLSQWAGLRPALPAWPLAAGAPMAHAWREETVPAGQTRWHKPGVVVPAGSTLVVVVR